MHLSLFALKYKPAHHKTPMNFKVISSAGFHFYTFGKRPDGESVLRKFTYLTIHDCRQLLPPNRMELSELRKDEAFWEKQKLLTYDMFKF